jgi:uncharacterized protein
MNKRNIFLILAALIIQGCIQNHQVVSSHVKSLEEQAKSGDAQSQFELGNAYDSGKDAPRDGHEAKKWYLKAAEQGHSEAQNSIGSIYQAEHSYQQAMSWYKKAAEKNHPLAINNIAYLYDLGLGVPQDRVRAEGIYLRSANLSWAEAMFNLGQMYGSGQLGSKDLIKGCMWTIRASKYSDSGRTKEKADGTVNYCKQTLSSNDFKKAKQEANSWAPKNP